MSKMNTLPYRLIYLMILATLFGLAGCAGRGAQTPSPIDQTSTVVARLVATSQASLSQTLAAQPSPTTVPTVPAGTAACRAADLSASAKAQPSTDVQAITLTFTNRGSSLCALQGPPDIRLISADGSSLDMVYNLNCFGCGQTLSPTPEIQATQIPQATQAAQAILTGQFGLAPGQSAQVLLLWRNECNALPAGEINARLILPDGAGNLDVPTGLYSGPACIDPGSASTTTIGQYQ
jgi:hypothetical protein